MDPAVGAPHRDLLVVSGKPITVSKVDAYTVRFTLAEPYAAAERFSTASRSCRATCSSVRAQGTLADAWTPATTPGAIAGLGPYRLKHYVAGQELVLERNPYYWKVDSSKRRLPYLDELVFVFAGNEDAQVIRLPDGESDLLGSTTADNFSLLSRDQAAKRYQLKDLGPALEYNFLVLQPERSDRQEPAARRGETAVVRRPELPACGFAGDRSSRHYAPRVSRAVRFRSGAMSAPGNRLWVNNSIPAAGAIG